MHHSNRIGLTGCLWVFVALCPEAPAQVPAECQPSCDQTCSGTPSIRQLCNEELEGAFNFVPSTVQRDENGDVVRDADGNCIIERGGTTGRRMCNPNLAAAAILSRLDIDGDGIPDNAADTDGDGLPDNWEVGGFEALNANGDAVDRVVFFPAPSAIVPGTPPTPIFTRLAVATNAVEPDTDGDGLTDFIEVFGLMFIDENRNGLLDNGLEWNDLNGDGLPSPGENPIDNSGFEFPGRPALLHDFDGFVFTDPFNPDTDGDGIPDGVDNDPLVNPRSFGNTEPIIVRFNAQGNADIDQDGLGNGMDMGNDLTSADGPGVQDFEVIDNPENVRELLELFRQDLLAQNSVPESAIEDLLGADWNGDGLWRTTDVRTWSVIIDPADPATLPPDELFDVQGHKLYATQLFADIAAVFNDDPAYNRYGSRGIGMGWQDVLTPTGRTAFIPDPRVWAVLYSWRVPGFDIDGDGFVGVPNASNTARTGDLVSVALVAEAGGRLVVREDVPLEDAIAFDDLIAIGETGTATGDPQLDGQIEVSGTRLFQCGAAGMIPWVLLFAGLRLMSRRRY